MQEPMKIWGITDMGLVRRENQDAYAVEQLQIGRDHLRRVRRHGRRRWRAAWPARSPSETYRGGSWRRLLTEDMDAGAAVRRLCLAAASGQPGHPGGGGQEAGVRRNMGTTLVSAVSCGKDGIVLANVGDSRAYRITAEGHHRASPGTTPWWRAWWSGATSPQEEARRHPNRNLITRALGTGRDRAECDGYHMTLWSRGVPAAVHGRPGQHRDRPGDAL